MKRIYSDWSKKVKIAMIERDLDMKDIAAKFHWTPQYASAIINGRVYYENPVRDISQYLEIEIPAENRTLSQRKEPSKSDFGMKAAMLVNEGRT